MDDYRSVALEVYGERCEICGYGIVEVHHINYQAHRRYERALRSHLKKERNIDDLLRSATMDGFVLFEDGQLSKDDRSVNLAVLCPNCHELMHKLDVGLNLLKAIPGRR